MNFRFIGAAAAAAVAGIASSAFAAPAITLTSDGDYYSAYYFTLGFSFTVTGNQEITALGAFDQGADGLNGSAEVGLWDASGDLLASAVVPAGTAGTLDGEFRYTSITPYALTAGVTYVVGAYEPNDQASSLGVGQGGSGSVNPNVTVLYDQFSDDTDSFAFPSDNEGHAGGAWLGANFELSAVPEPSTWMVMLAGFGLTGAAIRSRRRIAAA